MARPPPPTRRLPVAPLSIAERVVDELLARNAGLRIFMLGGDHSVAWPVVAAIGRGRCGEPWAIVHVDAHTDLLPERLGVRLCFATWAYHANELLGRGGRLVQVGVRASSRPKQHWESTLGVRQFWADEVRARGDAVIDDVIAHLRALGIARVYLSNDIDATDSATRAVDGRARAGRPLARVRARADRAGRARRFRCSAATSSRWRPRSAAREDARRTTDVAAGYMLATLAAMTDAPELLAQEARRATECRDRPKTRYPATADESAVERGVGRARARATLDDGAAARRAAGRAVARGVAAARAPAAARRTTCRARSPS